MLKFIPDGPGRLAVEREGGRIGYLHVRLPGEQEPRLVQRSGMTTPHLDLTELMQLVAVSVCAQKYGLDNTTLP